MEPFENHIHYHSFGERNGNDNEKRVVSEIEALFKEYPDTCFCSYCLDDIFNIALNSLPPKYEKIVAKHLDRRDRCSEREIEQAVRNAIIKVDERPKPAVEHTRMLQPK
ncbi:MAG: late competence development ComFB family protein [Nitrospinota bacterium]